MQTVSSRIWTRVTVSISYHDNHYTTATSINERYSTTNARTHFDVAGYYVSYYVTRTFDLIVSWYLLANFDSCLKTIEESRYYITNHQNNFDFSLGNKEIMRFRQACFLVRDSVCMTVCMNVSLCFWVCECMYLFVPGYDRSHFNRYQVGGMCMQTDKCQSSSTICTPVSCRGISSMTS